MKQKQHEKRDTKEEQGNKAGRSNTSRKKIQQTEQRKKQEQKAAKTCRKKIQQTEQRNKQEQKAAKTCRNKIQQKEQRSKREQKAAKTCRNKIQQKEQRSKQEQKAAKTCRNKIQQKEQRSKQEQKVARSNLPLAIVIRFVTHSCAISTEAVEWALNTPKDSVSTEGDPFFHFVKFSLPSHSFLFSLPSLPTPPIHFPFPKEMHSKEEIEMHKCLETPEKQKACFEAEDTNSNRMAKQKACFEAEDTNSNRMAKQKAYFEAEDTNSNRWRKSYNRTGTWI